MKTTLLPASLVALSLCAASTPAPAWAPVGIAAAAASREPAGAVAAQALDGWWQGFHDADIDRLVPAVLRAADASPGHAPRPAQLVSVLIGLREYATHVVLASERLAALQEQRRVAAGTRPSQEAAAALARLDVRVRAAQEQLYVHLQLRDAYQASWEVIAGPASARLPVALQAGLSAAALPSFEAAPPQSLPDAAGPELSQRLELLQTAHGELALEVERLRRGERHFQARHARDAAAAAPAGAEALEGYAQLLAQTDAVVSAKARLALAWVRFHQALGAP
jgi:hypothetical protein